MGLYETVDTFRKYDRVVVTGPQRAGTHIAAKIIADILGWEDVEEGTLDDAGVAAMFVGRRGGIHHKRDFKSKEYTKRYFEWVNDEDTKETVLQCPRISHLCHETPKGTLVVFMMRDVDEIVASDNHRIAKYRQDLWSGRYGQPVKSVFTHKARLYSRRYLKGAALANEEVPGVVYDVWNNVQKESDFDYYELDYNRLKEHKLWLPLEVRREKFTSGTQTCL